MRIAIILAVILFLSVAAHSQKVIYVMVQEPSNAGYNQYTDARYGIVTWLKEDPDWIESGDNSFLNSSKDAYISILRVSDSNWTTETLEWRKALKRPENTYDSILAVYIGHNGMLDVNHCSKVDVPCFDNMLFGCFTNNWHVKNTIIDTHYLMAPEAYVILPSIEMWVNGAPHEAIREMCVIEYDRFQNKNEGELVFYGNNNKR